MKQNELESRMDVAAGITLSDKRPGSVLEWEMQGMACRLDDGVVVGPGGFEAVGEFFYGLHAGAIPDEKSYQCRRQAADHPN